MRHLWIWHPAWKRYERVPEGLSVYDRIVWEMFKRHR